MTKRSLHPYLENVRKDIVNNVRWFLEHVAEEEEDNEAERFIQAPQLLCGTSG
jgi:hypothetical protein